MIKIFGTIGDEILNHQIQLKKNTIRGGSRAAVTSKMGRFVIKVNGSKPLTITTKRSILDVAAALNPPLTIDFHVIQFAQTINSIIFN